MRLSGLFLAAIPLGLGFLGIVFDQRRRGWQDRLAGIDVLYERDERTPARWSSLDPDAVAPVPASKVRGVALGG